MWLVFFCVALQATEGHRSDGDLRNLCLEILIRFLDSPSAACFLPVLVHSVEQVILCLSPAEPRIRKTLLANSTRVLKLFVKLFPMIAFNQGTQRMAVGTAMTNAAHPHQVHHQSLLTSSWFFPSRSFSSNLHPSTPYAPSSSSRPLI